MNVFQFSALAEMNWKANLAQMSGFEPKYTFYHDFAIAEFCREYMNDKKAIENTYNNVIKSWGDNYEALVEIILVLNHKSWAFFADENKENSVDGKYLGISKEKSNVIGQLYAELYEKADAVFFEKFGKNEKANDYYFNVLD